MKLGELFVDLGVNAGGAFNQIATFAFQFENLAHLSERATKWVDDFFGETPKYAHSLQQLSDRTGLSVENLQDLELAAKQSGTTIEALVGKYESLASAWTDWSLRGKDAGDSFAVSLRKMGFTQEEIAGFRTAEDFIVSILDKINNPISKGAAQQLKRALLPQEMYEAFDLYYNHREELEDAESGLDREHIRRLSDLDKYLKMVSENATRRYNRWKGDHAETFKGILKFIDDFNSELYEAVDNSESFGDAFSNAIDVCLEKLDELWKKASLFIDEDGVLYQVGKWIGEFILAGLSAVWDAVRGIALELKFLYHLFTGDLKKANKDIDSFFENSAIKGRLEKLMDDWKNKKSGNSPKAINGQSSEGYLDDEIIDLSGFEDQYSMLQPSINNAPVYNTNIYTDRDGVGTAYSSVLRNSRENTNILDSMLTRRFERA